MFSLGSEAAALCREQKLAGLYRIISPDKIKQAISQCHSHRRCARCPTVFIIYFVLALGLFCGDCYRQVFRWIKVGGKRAAPGRSTLCMARQRLGVRPLVKLAQITVELLVTEKTSPGASYRNKRLMALDGFVVDLPDSKANQVFGYAQGGRTPGAFPQARVVALTSASSVEPC